MRTFVGVFEANSSYRFGSDAVLMLAAPDGTVEAFTRYIDVGVELPLPGALQLNFKYERDVAFDAAARTMHSNAISVCEAAALAANCSVGVAQPVFISETTDGLAPREFYQQSSRVTNGTILVSRAVPVPPTAAFVSALISSSGLIGDRLKRAVGQYNLALRYWLPETLALALVHLFIAAETLTDVARDRSGMTDDDLAERQRIAMKLGPFKNRQDLMRAAKNYARHKFVFHDDVATHKRAADASDGFEHGFMDFESIKAAAAAVALPTAQHVRRAILELTDFDQGARAILLSEKFETPVNADNAQSISGFLMEPATDSNLLVPAVDMSGISVISASYDQSTELYGITRSMDAAIIQPIDNKVRFNIRH